MVNGNDHFYDLASVHWLTVLIITSKNRPTSHCVARTCIPEIEYGKREVVTHVRNQHLRNIKRSFETRPKIRKNLQELEKYKHSVRLTLESGNKDASAWLMKFRKSFVWRAAIETLNSNDASTGAKNCLQHKYCYTSHGVVPSK